MRMVVLGLQMRESPIAASHRLWISPGYPSHSPSAWHRRSKLVAVFLYP